jgi:RNA polymerase sigma-70 factor (ECF subfamily)
MSVLSHFEADPDSAGERITARAGPGQSPRRCRPMLAGPAPREEVLVEGLLRGDERAFEILVSKFSGSMFAVARRYLSHEPDAQDVVQESLLAAHKGISTFAGRAPLGAWLRGIVVKRALTRLRVRKRSRETHLDDLLPNIDASVASPQSREELADIALERSQLHEMVRDQIDRLPDTHRTVLTLRDIEELSTREAARRLGVTETCLKVRLHRARKALRALLQEQLPTTHARRPETRLAQ